MAGRDKHMERSHYSYQRNNAVTFAGFERKAVEKTGDKAMKEAGTGVMSKIKKMLRREQGR